MSDCFGSSFWSLEDDVCKCMCRSLSLSLPLSFSLLLFSLILSPRSPQTNSGSQSHSSMQEEVKHMPNKNRVLLVFDAPHIPYPIDTCGWSLTCSCFTVGNSNTSLSFDFLYFSEKSRTNKRYKIRFQNTRSRCLPLLSSLKSVSNFVKSCAYGSSSLLWYCLL